ncbi:MAG: GDP-L-fucose synthase [Bacteroidetes bacterium]|nr:GDP-L-fucose synthase [Bacteroidota bacterium]
MEINSKIYIAGHTGLVGSAIHRKLLDLGFSNFILKTQEELDLIDQKAAESFFKTERPEYVFDAAAKVGGIIANDTYRAQFLYENLMIQNHLIHFSYVYGVKKLLFLGSSCIYPKLAPQPIREEYLLTGLLEPTNEPYAIAKIAGIKMCDAYHDQYGCNFISVMPTNLYGPNDNYDLEKSHVLPALIRKMHLGKCLDSNDIDSIRQDLIKRPIEGINGDAPMDQILNILEKYGIFKRHQSFVVIRLWGTGSPLREFLYVDDLADAVVFLMNHYNAPDSASGSRQAAGSRHVNIGCGEDISIYDLAYKVKDITGFSGDLEFDSTKPDGTPRKLLDVSRLNALGWKPKISLDEGILQVYQNYIK